MNVDVDHPVAAAYLEQLDAAARAAGLGGGRRAELRAEIRAHVRDALAAGDGSAPGDDRAAPTDAAVADVLDRLGPVEDIVAAEAGPPVAAHRPAAPADAAAHERWGPLEHVALGLLTVGQVLLPIVGPLAGVACAWASQRWSRGGKILATVLGLAAPVLVAFAAAAWLFAGGQAVSVTPVPVPLPSVSLQSVPSP